MSSSKLDNTYKEPLSSIPLQTLLYFDQIFQIIFFIVEFIIFVFKGYGLYYPKNTIGIEIALLLAFLCAQILRITIGSAGNKVEDSPQIIWFLIICLPIAFFYAFFIRLQTYVIVIEIITNSIGLIFLGMEMLVSIQVIFMFHNSQKTKRQ